MSPVTHYLSTGCTILDLAIADRLPGGFAAGRISHVYGPESTAKSVLVQEPLGSAQRQGGEAWFADAEWTLDFGRADLFGLDVDERFHYSNPGNIEELFDGFLAKILKGRKVDNPPGAVAVDSLSALPSKTETKDAVGDTGYGVSRAKVLSAAFRKYIWRLNQANLALIFVDQTRDDIGGWGKYTVSGGKALKFYASTRILLEHSNRILNKNKKVIGVKIRFMVEKNKIAPPFREGKFRLLFDMGIDDVGTNIEWLRENYAELEDNDAKQKGTWYQFKDGKLGPGLAKACQAIEENDREDELVEEVERVWREVYATAKRKQRIRG